MPHFNTSGYVIGTAGGTNVVQLGATTVTAQPILDASTLSNGTLTFNAPVDLSGGAVASNLNPLLNVGSTAVTFNGLRDNGVATLTITASGTGTITVNPTAAGAYGMASPAAIVLSNTTSSRNWSIVAGTTAGTNMTVNGRITNNSTATSSTNTNNTFTFQTGGTLTLTDASSDALLSTGFQILGNSTLVLGVGNGAAGVGVLGARTNTLLLGANSSSQTTGATVRFTAPVTLDNPLRMSSSSTVPSVLTTNSDVTLNGLLTNLGSQGQLTLNNSGSGAFTLNGGVNLSGTTSGRTLTFIGNAPVTETGVIADGNGSTNGKIVYAGSSVLTLTGSNTYTGTTTVNGGVLATNNLAVSGTASGLGTAAAVTSGNSLIIGAAGTFRYTGPTFASFDRAIGGSTGYTIDVSQAATNLTATNAAVANGMVKTGPGTLTLTGATGIGNLTVNGGTLALGTAVAANILTNVGGVDIKAGQLSLGYVGSSPVATVRGLLAGSFGDAATPGVVDSGQLRSSTATTLRGLGYKDDGAGSVIVKVALFGDADLDGGVSINDFNKLAGNFGQASGKFWVDGDFDYDGGVSINDFNLLAGSFGQTLPTSSDAWAGLLAFAAAHNDLAAFEAVTGVPEPTSLGLVAAAGVLGLRRRTKR